MHFSWFLKIFRFIYFYGRHTRERGNLLTSKAHTRRQWVYKSFHATMSDFSLAQSSALTRGKEFSEKKRKMCINIILSLSVHTAATVVALCIYFWSPRDEIQFFFSNEYHHRLILPFHRFSFILEDHKEEDEMCVCVWLYLCQIFFYFTFLRTKQQKQWIAKNEAQAKERERENHWIFHIHNYHAQHIYKINIFLPASSSSSFPRHCWLAEV